MYFSRKDLLESIHEGRKSDLFSGIFIDEWVDELPRRHEYVGDVNEEQLLQSFWVIILKVQNDVVLSMKRCSFVAGKVRDVNAKNKKGDQNELTIIYRDNYR